MSDKYKKELINFALRHVSRLFLETSEKERIHFYFQFVFVYEVFFHFQVYTRYRHRLKFLTDFLRKNYEFSRLLLRREKKIFHISFLCIGFSSLKVNDPAHTLCVSNAKRSRSGTCELCKSRKARLISEKSAMSCIFHSRSCFDLTYGFNSLRVNRKSLRAVQFQHLL